MSWLRVAILGAWLLVMAVAVFAVQGHERTLRDGQLVLLQLAPVDPRSLLQGDYMALRFAVDSQLSGLDGAPAYMHLQLGDRQRGAFAGIGEQPINEPGVVSLRIRYHHGRPTVGPNAFFFQEGTATIYENARWGGFRVAADGTALLTSLFDAELQLLGENLR